MPETEFNNMKIRLKNVRSMLGSVLFVSAVEPTQAMSYAPPAICDGFCFAFLC